MTNPMTPLPSADTTPAAPSAAPRDGAPAAGLPGFTHRYADVNGTRLHAVVGGSGPALVLLHGWPTTWAEWRRIMAPLATAGHTVIAPDLRGTGDSAKPDNGYSKANIAEDIYQLVGSLLPAHGPTGSRAAPQIDLVGTDIGMMVAYAYAASHPAEVRRLVLAESLLPGFGLEELMNVADGGYWHFSFHMQLDIAEMLTAGKEAAYLGGMWAMFSPAGGLTEADTAEYLQHYAAPGGMRAGFQHYATLLEDGQDNQSNFTSPLAMPVLALNGELGIPQAQTLAAVHRVASNVTADLVPHAGHAFTADNPAWVAKKLTDWFQPDSEPPTYRG